MVLITVNEGVLRGRIFDEYSDVKIYSFQGIPYAEPPLKDLRFKAPRPPKPWTGIKDATEEGSESLSYHMFTRQVVGSEDCLNLNVFTPVLPPVTQLRPVMFFIHGGILSTGSSKTELYGPEFLVQEGVVLVTINYRLGILGFLSLEDPSLGVPGNAGFKDMVMALRWVNTNISRFGGDPGNVTIFGESAGGGSAHLLMLSPMTKGLFHKVIMQSGSGLCQWMTGRRTARMLAEELNFHTSDEGKILEFLRQTPALRLLEAQLIVDYKDFFEREFRFFGLVVEKPTPGEDHFMTKPPLELILTGEYHHVPMIVGYNEMEGMVFDFLAPPNKKETYFQDTEVAIPLQLRVQRTTSQSLAIAQRIRQFYYQGADDLNRQEHHTRFHKLCTDNLFFRDVFYTVRYHLTTALKPIYFYRLSIETELNVFKRAARIKTPGVNHGDDIGYLFKTLMTPEIVPGSREDIAQKRITRMWVNFAQYSDPTPGPEDQLLKIRWRPAEPEDNFIYLEIGDELTLKTNPDAESIAFWDEIFKINPTLSKL